MKNPIITLVFFILSSFYQLAISQENTVVHSIYFDTDMHTLQPLFIDSLLLSWNLNSVDSLQVEAYCDSDGSKEYNLNLAKRRCNFVLMRMDANGFDSSRKVIAKRILGEDHPKYPNNSSGNKMKNRRVDLIYVEKPLAVMKEEFVAPVIEKRQNEEIFESVKKVKLTEEILNQRIEESLKTGNNIALEDILFRPGLDVFQPYSMPTLEILFKVLSTRKDLEIEIQGHVCCVGEGQSDGSNYRNGSNHLSEDRAEAVKEYLINLGINPKRVKTRGFGGSKRLIYPETTEADMARNRRVEIKIISK